MLTGETMTLVTWFPPKYETLHGGPVPTEKRRYRLRITLLNLLAACRGLKSANLEWVLNHDIGFR